MYNTHFIVVKLYQCLSPLMLWVRIPLGWGVLNTTLCHKVCQWHTAGRWFFPILLSKNIIIGSDTSLTTLNIFSLHSYAYIYSRIMVFSLLMIYFQYLEYKSSYAILLTAYEWREKMFKVVKLVSDPIIMFLDNKICLN
jgi:hypothetical protein